MSTVSTDVLMNILSESGEKFNDDLMVAREEVFDSIHMLYTKSQKLRANFNVYHKTRNTLSVVIETGDTGKLEQSRDALNRATSQLLLANREYGQAERRLERARDRESKYKDLCLILAKVNEFILDSATFKPETPQ